MTDSPALQATRLLAVAADRTRTAFVRREAAFVAAELVAKHALVVVAAPVQVEAPTPPPAVSAPRWGYGEPRAWTSSDTFRACASCGLSFDEVDDVVAGRRGNERGLFHEGCAR